MNLDYMPLFVADLTLSTAEMTQDQFGAYVRLLCYAWQHGGLPNDMDACGRICGGMSAENWRVIRKRLIVLDSDTSEERLSHRRLEEVRSAVRTTYDKRCQAAAKARQARGKRGAPSSSTNVEINSNTNVEINSSIKGKAPSTSTSSSISFSSKTGFVGITDTLRAQWRESLPLIDLDHALGKARMFLLAHPERVQELEESGELLSWLTYWLIHEHPHRKPEERKPPPKSWLADYQVAEYRTPKAAARQREAGVS